MRQVLLAFSMMLTPMAGAQVLADTSTVAGENRTRVGAAFAASATHYDIDGVASAKDIDRTTLGAELSYGLTNRVDVIGQAGVLMDSKIEDGARDGRGYVVGAGARARAYAHDRLDINGYGLVTYQSETYSQDVAGTTFDSDLTATELHIGATAGYAVTPTVQPYGGLELVPSSDGKVKAKGGRGSTDFKRDNIVNMRVGANVLVSKVALRPEATFIGEQTFALAAGYAF